MKTGYTDRPILNLNEDLLGVKKYIDGLIDYITICSTPMTIAIQGDWGTGKTSIMNMIKDGIEDKCLYSWFNTWEFSQFNMSDELVISLLKSMVDSLNIKEENNNLNKSLKILANSLKSGTLMAIDMAAGGRVADTAEKVIDGFTNKDQTDYFNSIKVLKEQFQNHINYALEKSGKDRVIMFVDDLDRLNPEKAIELLEVLKNFLDCENCVFILAIDYKVVYKGIKLKYNNVLDENKGKAFFEKIIQLPFKVPVVEYNLYNYVKHSLQEIGYSDEINVNLCVELISNSIGKNPRAIKRLLNSALLLKKIQGDKLFTKESELILFGILCLQLSYEEVYNFFVTNLRDFNTFDELIKLTDENFYIEADEGNSLAEELNLDRDSILRVTKLMKSIINTIDQDNLATPSEEKILNFINLVGISTITSAYLTDDSNTKLEDEYRYKNRELCKAIKSRISEEITGIDFKVYQPRKNYDYWKRWNACVYFYQILDDVEIYFELHLITKIDTGITDIFYKIISASTKMEDKVKFKNLLQDKLEKFKEFTWDMDTGTYSMEFNNIGEYDSDEIVNLASEKYKEITEAIIN
ncbi:P-loop NTPase fold protein [Peptoniphilus harei]|uniref:KAP family P-loop NTPase fold protein n=1 Tax=Peptoniphilus harei TaxID=54005 RepID=UPI00254F1213|nr:P-loop NTPase fold protein [Peptoniphilus harei]MDK7354524.1 P-loop NTPase fold protein [Peptoniphilus harei]MDK7369847.1 P-loop NTPase fold protein [Peptoniphilus harei]